ncbi:hypothetical protein A1F97_11278, partial [Pyrenophora tritici-repentis]
ALYAKAQAFELHEVRGDLAVTDFLDALAAKIAPDWARNLRQTITTASAMGQPTMSLDDVARVFNLTMQEHEASGGKGRSTGVFSTFGGESAPSGGNSGGSTGGPRKYCPCKPGKPSHYWEPIKCRRLQQAITGKSDPGPTPIHLSDTDTRMINQRLHSSKFSTLLTQLKQAGWKINSAQQTSEKSKTTNTIVACVIDPRTLRDLSNAIFNLNYGGHPFSYSTIFDGGGALHLANDRNLLVPGTYKKCLDYLTVEAGTQSLPVSGVGDRLFKDFFNGPDGPQDLLLKNVMVVEGFHVNIVSEALLRKVGFWYTGYDWTI